MQSDDFFKLIKTHKQLFLFFRRDCCVADDRPTYLYKIKKSENRILDAKQTDKHEKAWMSIQGIRRCVW